MKPYIVLFVFLFIIIVFILLKTSYIKLIGLKSRRLNRTFKNKGIVLVIPLFTILFIFSLIIYSKTSIASALNAIELWVGVVFPSIFPFLVASEILNGTSFIYAIGVIFEPVMRFLFNVPGQASYLLALGLTSGYPVGAKATANMRIKNQITKNQGERLLVFCNNASPLFIMGAVATGMLGVSGLGPLLYICHIAASITVGIIFRFLYKSERYNFQDNKGPGMYQRLKKELFHKSKSNISSLFGDAILSSMSTMLAIGGHIIFFSVFINFLSESRIFDIMQEVVFYLLKSFNLSKNVITPLLNGFIEITTGLKLICNLQGIPLSLELVLISLIMGWGGLSVHFQVLNVVRNSDLKIKIYIFGKFIQGILSGLYTYIGMKAISYLPGYNTLVSSTLNGNETRVWQRYYFSCYKYLSIGLIFLCTQILLIMIFVYLSKKSKER
jgi:sporulation integral membrane protein YlbJ